MKNNMYALMVTGILAGMLLMGCEKTSEQKMRNANENVGEARQELKSAQTEFEAEWQAFKRESEQTIAANEKKIDAFKEKMEKAGPKIKAKYNKQVELLEKKNSALKEKLENYKDDGQSKWQEFKMNFKADMDAVGKTITDLFSSTD